MGKSICGRHSAKPKDNFVGLAMTIFERFLFAANVMGKKMSFIVSFYCQTKVSVTVEAQ